MSEIRLFTVQDGTTKECAPDFYKVEKEVQNLFESNLEALLAVRFVAFEYTTSHGGRIDTLGIDENGFPVVIEYKRDKDPTVINQGMSYMGWLLIHREAFWKIVFEKLGKEVADSIDYSYPRLICVAKEFTRDDLGAYMLMPSSIDLVRYRRFGDGHLLLERVQSANAEGTATLGGSTSKGGSDKPVTQVLEEASEDVQATYAKLRDVLLQQGEDVTEKITKLYIAFKRTKNFATVVVAKSYLLLFLHLDPSKVEIHANMRDMREIGHWGTGNLEVRIASASDVEAVTALIHQAYEGKV